MGVLDPIVVQMARGGQLYKLIPSAGTSTQHLHG